MKTKNIEKNIDLTTTFPKGSFVRTKKGQLLKILDSRYIKHSDKGLEIGYLVKLIKREEDKKAANSERWISNFEYPDLIQVDETAWFLLEQVEVKNAIELHFEKNPDYRNYYYYTYLFELTNGMFVKASKLNREERLSVATTYYLKQCSINEFEFFLTGYINKGVVVDWIVPTEIEAKERLVEELI